MIGFWRLFLCCEVGIASASEYGWKYWLRTGVGFLKLFVGMDGEIKDFDVMDWVVFMYFDEEFLLFLLLGEYSDKYEVLVMF